MDLMKTSRSLVAGLASFLALCPASWAWAQPDEVVSSFASGPPSGTYAFASWTPRTMSELMQGNGTGQSIDIAGHLFLPPGDAKVPAVVLVHGSGGLYKAVLEYWPKHFNAAGLAVFTLDMFGPRGVRSMEENPSLVPSAADVADAFAALRLLATHPRIDARRIAVMGFSRGGTAVLRAAAERVMASQKLPDDLRFAAYLPTYTGGCSGISRLVVKPGVFSKAPMLFLHGDADDYTPIEPCQDYADRIAQAGTPVKFIVIEGARHKFDSDDPRRHHLRHATRTTADCPIEIDIGTMAVYHRETGGPLQGEAYRSTLKTCVAVGATVQGSSQARDRAKDAAIDFLKKTLGP